MKIEVWYDGCCEPKNPGGNAAFGALIKIDGITVWTASQFIGSGQGMSNNVAEYSGMIGVLEELLIRGLQKEKILVRGDNMMTIEQMAGNWRARGGLYIPYYLKCKELVKKFKRIKFQWIPREENPEADELSKQILVNRGVQFRIQPEAALCQSNVPGQRVD